MNILVKVQEEASKGKDSFAKWLESDCKAMIELQKNNMFSIKGKSQLKEIQNKVKEMKK